MMKPSQYHNAEFELNPAPNKPSRLLQWLKQAWNSWLTKLFVNDQLSIKLICNKLGETRWEVYDPASQKIAYFYSEEEVRIWLDERHRRL